MNNLNFICKIKIIIIMYMTCFWDAILSTLNAEDFKLLGLNSKPNRETFIKTLQSKNQLATNVFWMNKPLREQELKEHEEAVKCYNVKGIYRGHLTSICDSFLILLCELLQIEINHRYMRSMISYKNKNKVRKRLSYRSNRGHFQRG